MARGIGHSEGRSEAKRAEARKPKRAPAARAKERASDEPEARKLENAVLQYRYDATTESPASGAKVIVTVDPESV